MFSFWMIPVFAYCVWVGKLFAKSCKGHWAIFLFLPTAFMTVAFFVLTRCPAVYWLIYLAALLMGCVIGLLITNPMPVKVDLMRQTVSAPGSWLTFVCLMVLCISKYMFDWLYLSRPEHILQLKIIGFGLKGIMTGLLYGQALSFWYRFWIASKCTPAELIHGRFVRFCGMKKVSVQRG